MKNKILNIITILFLLFFALQINVYAASIPLNSVNVTLSESKVAPRRESKS